MGMNIPAPHRPPTSFLITTNLSLSIYANAANFSLLPHSQEAGCDDDESACH